MARFLVAAQSPGDFVPHYVAQFGYGSRVCVLHRDKIAHSSDGTAKNSQQAVSHRRVRFLGEQVVRGEPEYLAAGPA